MYIDIQARDANSQIIAREIINRCIPDNVFNRVYANVYNIGKEYIICNRSPSFGGGFVTFGLDMKNRCLIR